MAKAEKSDLENCVDAILSPDHGETRWHFFGARGDRNNNSYILKFLSRGGMRAIMPDQLGYLGDYIEIDTPDAAAEVAPRMVTYTGPIEGLGDFTTLMRDKLLLPIDDTDPLEGFNGPLTLLDAVISSSLNEGQDG